MAQLSWNLKIQKLQSNHCISKLLAYKYLTRIGKFQLISDKHSRQVYYSSNIFPTMIFCLNQNLEKKYLYLQNKQKIDEF